MGFYSVLGTTLVLISVVSEACFPGSFVDENNSCTLCPAGKYSMQAGATLCFACMAGSFTNQPGMSQCTLSGLGEFVPKAGCVNASACSPGTFQYVGGSSACLSCPIGSFQPSQGASFCVNCALGMFQSEVGQSSCSLCDVGMFVDQVGQTSCTLCPIGSIENSTGSMACRECSPGTYQPHMGESTCLPCYAGSSQGLVGADRCQLCAVGEFQSGLEGSSCLLCPNGTFSSVSGTSECEKCPVGAYSTAQGASACVSCAPGRYSDSEGQVLCLECSVGTFQTKEGATFCDLCGPGTFGVEHGECLQCVAGTFSTGAGISSPDGCEFCRPGRFSSVIGSSSDTDCVECQVGTMSSHDRSHCLACPYGTLCVAGSATPLLCRDERLLCNGTHQLAVPGALPFLYGNCTGALQCPLGSQCYQAQEQDPGILSTFPSSGPYFVVFRNGSLEAETSCDGVVFSYGVMFVDPSYPPVAWDAVEFILAPRVCPAGTFLLSGQCAGCPVGTASSEVGAFHVNTCRPCGPGTYASDEGSSSCLACVSGTYQQDFAGAACLPCPIGTYQSESGATGCRPCPPGWFGVSLGSSSCSPCDAGTAQPDSGRTVCVPCNSSQFSSRGDAVCTACGSQVIPSDCPTVSLGAVQPGVFYMSIRGEARGSVCLGLGIAEFRQERLIQRVHPFLSSRVRCVHTLGVMGRADLQRTWVSVHGIRHRATQVEVIPFGSRLNLALCGTEGLGVAYVLRDADGRQDTDLRDVQVTLAVLDSHGTDLLFWSACTDLPEAVTGVVGIFMGRCLVSGFCPTTDVLVRITVAWPDGSVWGETALAVERPVLCPPSSSWVGLVELTTPGMRFYGGDRVDILLGVGGLGPALAGFRIRLQVMRGFEFTGFESNHTATFHLIQREFWVEGEISSDAGGLLGRLTLQVTGNRAGVIQAIRVLDYYLSTMQATGFSMPVRLQGFVCGSERILSVLVERYDVIALVAQTSHPVIVSWNGFQPDVPDLTVASVEVVGVWNRLGKISVPQGVSCVSLRPKILNVASCTFLRALPTAVGGVASVSISFESLKVVVSLPVLAVVNHSVTIITGLDGVSGRFKVMSRFRSGPVRDYFGGVFDVTPYLSGMTSSGVVLHGEEWLCDGSSDAFAVGNPVLFKGNCIPKLYTDASSVFLFTGGRESLGSFLFNPSILQPSMPAGTLLALSSDGGLPLPLNVRGEDPGRLNIDRETGTVSLLRLGMSSSCVSLGDGALVPVVPASLVGLRVVLSATVLVTQHDIWGLMPTLARVTEAYVDLSDGTWLNVTEDERLRWDAVEGLTVVPRVGFETGSVSGNFTANFRFEGAPCLMADVILHVYAYSMRSSRLVCTGCGLWLALQGDPFEGVYPVKVPVSAFMVSYMLMDGSVVNRSASLRVSGPGYVQEGFLYGAEPGLITVSADETQDLVHITVIERWLTYFMPLCNGLACDGSDGFVRLTSPKDGASMAPFRYPSALNITVRLSLFDGTHMDSPLLHGMDLWVNDTFNPNNSVHLAFGDLRLRLSLAGMYRLADWEGVLHVARLERLVLSGPLELFQIHCSRVWEQATYVALGVLSDGENSTNIQPLWESDGQVIHGGAEGSFSARYAGCGWIRVEWGNVTSSLSVIATQSSKYFTHVHFPNIPSVWEGIVGDRLQLSPVLFPVFEYVNASIIEMQVLRWSSFNAGIVQFTNDSAGMVLLSSYPIPFQIQCVLRGCMSMDPIVSTFQLSVNVQPSVNGQIDLGEDVGIPFNDSSVGSIVEVPVYIYTVDRLRDYLVEIVFDNVSLSPIECSGGDVVHSRCVLSTRFEASGNFSASHRTGRVLVAVLRGQVMLSAFSQIYVVLRRALVGSFKVLPASTSRFTIAVGKPDPLGFLQPLVDWVGPLADPPRLPEIPDRPVALRVCCSATVAGPSALLASHFPVSFVLSYVKIDAGNVSLQVTDPRLRFFYDRTLLEYSNGSWTPRPGGVWVHGVARIDVEYTHPGSPSLILRESVNVWLADVERLQLTSELLEIRRVHCASTVFQTVTVHGELVLAGGMGVIPLAGSSVARAWVNDPHVVSVVSVSPHGVILLQGLSVGNTIFRVSAGTLEVHARILVLNESVVFASYSLQKHIRFSGCSGQSVFIPVNGTLRDGTVFTNLTRIVPMAVNAQGPVRVGDEQSLILVESGLGGHLSLHSPSCQGSAPVTLQADFGVHLTSCIKPFRQPVDVELFMENNSVGGISLVGSKINSYFVHGIIQPGAFVCDVLEQASDCRVDERGRFLLAGYFRTPRDRVLVAYIRPVPERFWGFVEVFAGTAPVRVPIVSGRLGGMPDADPVKALMPDLPFFDTASLVRGDRPDFILRLMTDRARLAVSHFFSDERELSLMFRVTDRFGQPDAGGAKIYVVLPASSGLPLLSGGVAMVDGGQIVPALHIADGWYAVQWSGRVKDQLVKLKYTVGTGASLSLDEYVEQVRMGRPFHVCPRKADQVAVFLMSFRLFIGYQNFDSLASLLVCRLHVPRRRIGWTPDNATSRWGVLTVGVESFLRMADVRTKLSTGWIEGIVRIESRRMLRALPDVLLYEQGLKEVTDPADGDVPCPKGMYFSANGTFAALPVHALAGDDCYGMVCVQGYREQNGVCIPEELPNGVLWICLVVILSGVFLVVCLLCCVYLSKTVKKDEPEVSVDQASDDIFDDVFPSSEWGPQSNEQVLDDYSVMILDDPMRSPVTFGEFRR